MESNTIPSHNPQRNEHSSQRNEHSSQSSEHRSQRSEHRSTRHLVVMLIGCIAMFAGLALLAVYSPSNSYLAFGLVLLCPLMHLFMMRNHHHESSND